MRRLLQLLLRRRLPAALLLLGATWRLFWLSRQGDDFFTIGEAPRVAVSLAQGTGIANAFAADSGPTAHLTPVQPVIASLVYRMTGVESVASGWLLSLLALGYVLAAAAIMYRVAMMAGFRRSACLVGLGLFCLLPLNPHIEMMEFRTWEGGLAALLAAVLLWLVVRADRAGKVSGPEVALAALVAALLFFVSPPLGLGGYACCLILCARTMDRRATIIASATASIALALVLAPWVIRNERVFHHFIPLRSNFGLEFALANNARAAASNDSNDSLISESNRLHPIRSDRALATLRAVGETGYAQQVGAESSRWARDHPADFTKLTALHAIHYFFPAELIGSFAELKRWVGWAISALGLIGALLSLTVWKGRSIYIAIMAVVPAVPYVLVHSNERYRYIVELPLMFLAAASVSWLLDRVPGRGGTGRPAA